MGVAPSRLLLHELTREEARRVAPDTLVVWPVGAIEQHGPHLPVATDTFTVEHIAREAARHAAAEIPVVVAPTLPFGSSHHHLPFGGTMSLATETYYRVLYDLGESLITGGFRRLFILNGHGGNHELVQLAARDLALKHPVAFGAASYWTMAWDALTRATEGMPGRLPGHAGIYETSQILALRPELVQEPRPHRDGTAFTPPVALAPYRFEFNGFWRSIDGYTDSPDLADGERGRAYLAAAVDAVARGLIDFYRRAEAPT